MRGFTTGRNAMPIDHMESLRRAVGFFYQWPYRSPRDLERLADVIDAAVKETALECSEICRRHADRAPGGLVPVGVRARASDEIRFQFGLTGKPYEALAPESKGADAPSEGGSVTEAPEDAALSATVSQKKDFPGTPGIEGQ